MSGGLGRVFSTGLMVSAVTVTVAVVRGKVAAVYLGPEGLGITAEVTQALTLALLPAVMAGGPALQSAVARSVRPDADPGAHATAQGAYDTAWTLTVGLGVVGVLAAALLARFSYPWGARGWWWVLVMGAGMAVANASNVTGRVLAAAGQVRSYSGGSVAGTALQALSIAGGTVIFGLPGFFFGNVVGAVLAAPVWQVVAARSGLSLRTSPRPRVESAFLPEVARLGAAAMAGQGTTQATQYVLRTAISQATGSATNGLFQSCWSIDAVLLGSVQQTFGGFVFPRYAAAKDRAELVAEIDAAGSFVLRVAPPVLLAAIAVRGPVLVALYSAEFRPAAALLGWMLAGDVAKLVSWTQGGVLLYRGHARIFAILQLVSGSLFAGLALAGLWGYGLVGIGYGYFVTYMLNVLLTGVALRSAEGITPRARTVALAWGGSLLALACNAAVGAFWWGPAIPLLAAAVWAIAAGAPQAVVALWRSRRRR